MIFLRISQKEKDRNIGEEVKVKVGRLRSGKVP